LKSILVHIENPNPVKNLNFSQLKVCKSLLYCCCPCT
jgi:hypothetical protein